MANAIENSTELNQPVLFPKTATSDSTTDFAHPLELLLIDLGVNPLPEDKDKASTDGVNVPASVAIIEAGATQFSKGTRALVGAVGGVAAISAYVSSYWLNSSDPVRAVTVGGAALLLAAVAIAISIVVSSDVKARALAGAAQYHARAQIAEAYLRGAATTMPSSAPLAPASTTTAKVLDPKTAGLLLGVVADGGLRVQLKNGDDHTAHKVRYHEATGELEVRCGPADWRTVSEIVAFDPTT